MKNILIATLVTLAPALSFAQPITLQPGSSVVINGDVVSCVGAPADQLPACGIKQDGNAYRLYAGSTVMQSYYGFESALEGAKKAREAGLCR